MPTPAPRAEAAALAAVAPAPARKVQAVAFTEPGALAKPAGHGKQLVPPPAGWYEFAGHLMQLLAPGSALKVPGGHDAHAVAEPADAVPGAQALQAVAPWFDATRPASQGDDCQAPAAQKVPAAQSFGGCPPPSQKFPGGHASQTPALVLEGVRPAGHDGRHEACPASE